MIPDEDVERVRDAADIVQIIGEHVNLRRVGTDWRGPCPFHQGTHRNFSVSPKKRMYYCFVCHAGGDVFNFLQKRLGMDWPSAVRAVADKSGVDIRETDTRREGPDPREPVWELNATAAEYFQRTLWEDDLGQPAREYLAKRNITREAGQRFGLGFAPREIGLLRSYLNTLGFDDDRLLTGGLLVKREEAEEPRPRFRGRLMFPIYDASGRLSGFGGRLIGPGEPKYLNSADSPTFTKGRLLYGLNWARHAIRRDERLLLVEGYFDVVRLVLAGIESVVAPLGTALTDDQAAMIARQAKNVFLLYDSDVAGQKATFRAGDLLLAQGVSVRVVTLPEGEDPDTFVRAHGSAGLEAQIEASIDVFDRKIQILERAGWFGELQKKRRALDRLLPTIRATSDELMRDLYVVRASEVTGVDREILNRELGSRQASSEIEPIRQTLPQRPTIRGRTNDRREPRRNAGSSAERELIRAMLNDRSRVEPIAERIGPDAFRNPAYRAIFSALLESGEEKPIDKLSEALDADSIELMQEMLGEGDALINLQRTIDDSITRLHVRDMEERLAEIDSLIPLANDIERESLAKEREKLVIQMRASGKMTFKAFRRGRAR